MENILKRTKGFTLSNEVEVSDVEQYISIIKSTPTQVANKIEFGIENNKVWFRCNMLIDDATITFMMNDIKELLLPTEELIVKSFIHPNGVPIPYGTEYRITSDSETKTQV